jgi:hypothetical protein
MFALQSALWWAPFGGSGILVGVLSRVPFGVRDDGYPLEGVLHWWVSFSRCCWVGTLCGGQEGAWYSVATTERHMGVELDYTLGWSGEGVALTSQCFLEGEGTRSPNPYRQQLGSVAIGSYETARGPLLIYNHRHAMWGGSKAGCWWRGNTVNNVFC